MDNFIHIPLTIETLDIYFVRTSLFSAVQKNVAHFKGIFLDIGCGRMPYKSFILDNSLVEQYIGLDFPEGIYAQKQLPDISWDGTHIPLMDNSVDCVMATEVLEHCPEPEIVLHEIYRVLQPGGVFFFTVPFLWPLHDAPYDQYRYTPFALTRLLQNAGFGQISLHALGGWDAGLAQMIGLWVRRRPLSSRKRKLFSRLALPFVKLLIHYDRPPQEFVSQTMMTGLSGRGFKERT